MIKIAYFSPFVPPEWIAAHRMRPVWLPGVLPAFPQSASSRRGVCRCAEVLVDHALECTGAAAIVLTTICDQMRYAAAYLGDSSQLPVFLFNVPSTWQNPEVRRLYRQELLRLGRFLESLGGCLTSLEDLKSIMQRYENARSAVRGNWFDMSGSRYVESLAELRDNGRVIASNGDGEHSTNGVPLALVGGPLMRIDYAFLQLVAKAGGRIVLDASECGERTLPAPLDPAHVRSDPLEELTRAYFDHIPDVFRRPNTRLYEWLDEQLSARGVRGILFWRRLFCDLWHAELEHVRQWSAVPLLDIDVADGDGSTSARTLGKIEAFLEMLQ